jgi:ribosome-binding protein aMBF1 (putative translation factor)
LPRGDLGTIVGTSGAVIGRCQLEEITPSVEIANKIAHALEVSLDYLVMVKEKKIVERIEGIASMPDDEQKQILVLLIP